MSWFVGVQACLRSTEKAALQEIEPRFTLKLESLRTGFPAVRAFGEPLDEAGVRWV